MRTRDNSNWQSVYSSLLKRKKYNYMRNTIFLMLYFIYIYIIPLELLSTPLCFVKFPPLSPPGTTAATLRGANLETQIPRLTSRVSPLDFHSRPAGFNHVGLKKKKFETATTINSWHIDLQPCSLTGSSSDRDLSDWCVSWLGLPGGGDYRSLFTAMSESLQSGFSLSVLHLC